ncbi:MAG: hypothetical protein ACRDT6_17855 [Micromonosporaceae bacterium]
MNYPEHQEWFAGVVLISAKALEGSAVKNTHLRRMAIAALNTLLMVATLSIATPGTALAHHTYDQPHCPTGYYEGVEYHCQIGSRIYSEPNYNQCNEEYSGTTHYMEVCVLKPGDHIYVKDKQSDGKSAVAEIVRRDRSGIRRVCRNNQGAGTWVHCNFNWSDSEYNSIAYQVYGYEFNQYASGGTWSGTWAKVGLLFVFYD